MVQADWWRAAWEEQNIQYKRQRNKYKGLWIPVSQNMGDWYSFFKDGIMNADFERIHWLLADRCILRSLCECNEH